MKFLEVRNVTKLLKGKEILSDITFDIAKGEIVGLIGPNGAGKTSLLKILSNLTRPDSGKAFLDKISINDDFKKVSHRIGYLIEEPSLYPYLTAKEHLELCIRLQAQMLIPNKIQEISTLLGISGFLDKKVKKMSMGMKQKLGIACAMIHDPDLIILDEPTNSLDIKGVEQVKKYLVDLKNRGKTIIISSHLLGEIQNFCDKFLVIENGRLVHNVSNNNPASTLYRIKIDKYPSKLPQANEFRINNFNNYILVEVPNHSLQSTLKILLEGESDILDIEKVTINLEQYF